MATLLKLVEQIPLVYRIKYDFATFWIPQVNEVIKLINKMAILPENTQEHGVVIKGGKWIDIPATCRRPINIYNAVDENSHYPFSIVNNRVKLKDTIDSSIAVPVTLRWLSSKSVEPVGVSLATAETYVGQSIIDSAGFVHVISVAADVAGTVTLTLQYDVTDTYNIYPDETMAFQAVILPSNDCYMIKGIFDYPNVVSEYDEVPLSDKYGSAIITGLRLAIQKEQEDLSQVASWFQLLQFELGTVKLDTGMLKKIEAELGIMNNAATT